MFKDKINGLQVKKQGGSYIDLGQYIVEAKYGYNKLFSQSSGRNLQGKMISTLVGVFPKIVVQFRKLTKSELEIIVPILDASRQVVRYYDPKKKAYNEMTTYTGDYEIVNKSIVDVNGHKNEGFSVSFIAVQKR